MNKKGRSARKEFQGKLVPTKSQKGARVSRVAPEAQSKIKGPGTPPGAAHGRDLARQRAIDSARPQWQRCLDGTGEKSGEERDPPGAGEFKDKRVAGQEPSGSPKGTPTVQPAGIQESQRRRAQSQEEGGQGVSTDRPSKEPQEVGISKSLQEQGFTASIRRAYPSQSKEGPEAKQQAGAGL